LSTQGFHTGFVLAPFSILMLIFGTVAYAAGPMGKVLGNPPEATPVATPLPEPAPVPPRKPPLTPITPNSPSALPRAVSPRPNMPQVKKLTRKEESDSIWNELYLEVFGSVGSARGAVPSGSSSPTLAEYGVGVTAGARIGSGFFLGLTSDFRSIVQLSDTSLPIGNHQGTRWNYVGPMAGWQYRRLILKADLQGLGNYNFTNLTGTGQTLQYTAPIGGRATALFRLFWHINAGAHFEYLTFGGQTIGGTLDTDFAKRIPLWQAGGTLAWVL
jgi:hypothetical protein